MTTETKPATTCKSCNRIVYAIHVDAQGYCFFCHPDSFTADGRLGPTTGPSSEEVATA